MNNPSRNATVTNDGLQLDQVFVGMGSMIWYKQPLLHGQQ